MKKMTRIMGLALLLLVAYWVYLPSPIEPAVFRPQPAPKPEGTLAPNSRLREAALIAQGRLDGPEDIVLDQQGRLYTGTMEGSIMRVLSDGTVEEFARTGGRPLGLAFDAQQNLIVCDAFRGLLSIAPDKTVTPLVEEADGIRIRFADDLDIDHQGRIYFSDASIKHDFHHYSLDFLESKPWGRLIRFDPSNKEVKVLLEGLYFANGVALSKQQDYLLINETARYRIRRYWLSGERAGQDEVLIDNLPGFPDNISLDEEGYFWVAMPTTRKRSTDWLLDKPWLKQQIVKLPRFLQAQPSRVGYVLQLDGDGRIMQTLQDPDGEHLRLITSAKPLNGQLYFGSVENDRIGTMPIPAQP